MKWSILVLLISITLISIGQDKRGYSVVVGGGIYPGIGAMYMEFDGTTAKPVITNEYNVDTNMNAFFLVGNSNICDSTSGQLLITCNGMTAFNHWGDTIENGDHLQPDTVYNYYCCPSHDLATQGSIILPKGSNGSYYIFISTITDSSFNYWWNAGAGKFPYDLVQYHVVDMNANNAKGKVVQKNVPVIQNVELTKLGMTACRHANGRDWWILKHAHYDSNKVYSIYVSADTVQVVDTMNLGPTPWDKWDLRGQACFSKDGKHYAFSTGSTGKLLLADFDRCSGQLHNSRIINIPLDSVTNPNHPGIDSTVGGLAFSQNGKFLYVSKFYTIFQYELDNPDSATAWYRVKHGSDTTELWFEYYCALYRGIDNRIYIGKYTNQTSSMSVIDSPDNKGSACSFCRKCLRFDSLAYGMCTPANVPDFNLGPDSSGCWPVQSESVRVESVGLIVYPNPTHNKLYFKTTSKAIRELYNAFGVRLLFTKQDEMGVGSLASGIYYVKVSNEVRKVVIE